MSNKPDVVRGASDPVLLSIPEAAVPFGLPTEDPEGSPLDRLLHSFESHIAAETDTVREYRRLADTSPDPAVRLLMQLVLEDEERHHGLLERMAARIRNTLYWTHSAGALPTGSGPTGENARQELRAIERFARQEQEGVRHLRELARRDGDLHNGLFGLLLETMAMDSEKHQRILRFMYALVQRRLEAESKS